MVDAGWYADPAGSGRRRWWDGHHWSDVLEPEPVYQPWQYGPPLIAPPMAPPCAPHAGEMFPEIDEDPTSLVDDCACSGVKVRAKADLTPHRAHSTAGQSAN